MSARERPAGTPESPGVLGVGSALSALRLVREGLGLGLDAPEALIGGASALPGDVRRAVERAARRLQGEYREDEWGFDEEFADQVLPLLDFLYDHWWRIQTLGAANVPGHGRALMVANHAGILPWDATMISMGLLREHPLPRYPRSLVLDWAFGLPWISVAIRKMGGVAASPFNALRLLEQEQLVAAFPEGVQAAGKPYRDRYRLQRFGRGGFVELALRTGASIIPVAVVGSEEIYPRLGDAPLLAKAIGAPFFPLTPLFPWLGPLGAVPLPSRWLIEFCEPVDTARHGPEAADDRSLVLELSEQVSETIQRKLLENVARRGPAFA